jgi:hypothetical protein
MKNLAAFWKSLMRKNDRNNLLTTARSKDKDNNAIELILMLTIQWKPDANSMVNNSTDFAEISLKECNLVTVKSHHRKKWSVCELNLTTSLLLIASCGTYSAAPEAKNLRENDIINAKNIARIGSKVLKYFFIFALISSSCKVPGLAQF